MKNLCVVSLGSNLGNRMAYLKQGAHDLQQVLSACQTSSVYETAPWGVVHPQPPYLNMIICGYSDLSAGELLHTLAAVEAKAGRRGKNTGEARTLDLDIIFMGNTVMNTSSLQIPHPRFAMRRFVMLPLAELLPDFIDPLSQHTVRQLLAECNDTAEIKKVGTL